MGEGKEEVALKHKLNRNSGNKKYTVIIIFFKKSLDWLNTGLIDTATESRAREKSNMFYSDLNL